MAVKEQTSSFEPKPFGRYVLLDKLAVGGMAEIYKAKTYGIDGFEKLLAIKRILPHCAADRDFINMLVDEAKLTVLLSHANIVQVYDLGKVGDDYFISMEFIYGTNLREFMNRFIESGEKTSEDMAVYIMSEVCKGLDYAHRKTDSQGKPLNIVHRDISPQNVLLSYEGEVKIVDFGIAKAAMNVSHTMAGILKGKVAYMSPEQALGKPIDHRTDIFSAGVLLYEMLNGEKLFTGETQFEVLNQIRTTRINTLMLPDHIPGPLKGILAKSLAYNLKDRYQSAGDFQLELTKYLYSSYTDFSPRQLSSILRKLFDTDIKRREAHAVIDEQTNSAIQQTDTDIGQKTQNLVTGKVAAKARKPTLSQETEGAGTSKIKEAVIQKISPRALVLGAGILLTLLGGYWGYHFLKTTPSPAPSKRAASSREHTQAPTDEVGSIVIETTPSGAKIILNNADTSMTTPATVSKLALGYEYQIKLERENYKDFSKTVAITSSEPVKVKESLQALAKGIIEIDSNPRGAKIVINNTDTGMITPAKVENLEISKNYNLKLALPNYYDWSGSVEVKNFDPVKLQAALVPQPTPQTPQLPPTPQQMPVNPVPTASQNPQAQTPPTPPPQVPNYGKIQITSTPGGASIFLNGQNTGHTTPYLLDKLEGNKKVNLSLVREGYTEWKRSIKVISNKTIPLTASLKEMASLTPPPTATPSTPVHETAEETIVNGKPGTISVNSEPSGADVYINSENKGTTPLKIANVPPGSVKVIISKEGYLRYNATIKLASGENKSLGTVQLGGMYGEVSINSNPPRASVYFDGERIGARTPVTIRRVPRDKTHNIKVELDGFRPWQSSVNLQDQESKKYDVILEQQ